MIAKFDSDEVVTGFSIRKARELGLNEGDTSTQEED